MKFTNNSINTIIRPDEEENAGFEVAARSPDAAPATAEMAPEELEDFEEEENAPTANNRCLTKKRLIGVSVVATIALALFVGVAWSVKSPASSNTMAVSKQAAVAAAAKMKVKGYEKVGEGDGVCVDTDGEEYPYLTFDSITTPKECPGLCGCAQDTEGVKYRGFIWHSVFEYCDCLVDPVADQAVLSALNSACAASCGYEDFGGSVTGSGGIKSIDSREDLYCYALKSKASKAPKRGDES